MTNIVLIGFMGSGKSLVAKRLAMKTKRPLVSTDQMVEKTAGKAISVIFTQEGEAHFRKLEGEAVAQAAAEQGVIIDCGGGVVLAPENMRRLKETGTVFYLAADPAVLYARLKGQRSRPLLKGGNVQEKIQRLLTEREGLYQKADHTVETGNREVDEICGEILKIMEEKA